MARSTKLLIICGFISLLSSISVYAEDWRDQMEKVIYSPRYFGPNGFPMPELQSGSVGKRWEVELRGEYDYYKGDKTKDLYARLFIPIAKGRAGIEISGVIIEDYTMSPETRDERFAVELTPPIKCFGDLIATTYVQVVRSEKWADVMVSLNLKTASGGRLCDARFTDAATYWFDATAGRTLLKSADEKMSLRVQAMIGFYCWMTNNMVHRQNDAVSYGGGLTGIYRNFTLTADLSGIKGYKNNGDRPMAIRTKLNYEIKKNIISFRYRHGMKDDLYDRYSLGYIRCF
ncbi:hypothetical protein [Parabacteroides bouchesdurhonensis]|uniref:hypothetical protein n=1 Tax=Parabacteroides bouchesdurhonensis TaxID=1936995 RepID=UPI000C837CF1|nr:hypothetical protein [Parabacteroides bouchesdurhonensis]RHJ95192.1 hypothetical protein DW095_01865 [Bacteroides sp. AM07-16]